MTFDSKETGLHLRAKTMLDGSDERMRAIQALSYGYGTGSRAALATMLLATLGGCDHTGEMATPIAEDDADQPATTIISQIAEPMQQSANDPQHVVKEANASR